jgi:predicted dehydrogenase
MSQKSEGENRAKSSNVYNAIIVGAGKQGCLSDIPGGENANKIISFAHAFKEHPGFKWLAFYDEIEEKAYLAKEMWGGTWYISLDEIKDHPVDIAVITTPDDSHYEILKQLAEYPLKLVICEKPICNDLQQAREIVELYKAKNIPLMVNYTRNFLPYYEELKQRYLSGEFGKLVWGKATFNRGVIHTGTHAISFLNWIEPSPEHKHSFYCLEPFENYRIWQIDLYFEEYHWQEQRIGDDPVWPYYDKSHLHVVENAFNFLEGREPLKCSGEDALAALKICFELMGERDKNEERKD